MSKYIDAEKLIAGITRIDNEHPVHISERYEDGVDDGYHGCCDEIITVIESLQQEQQEEPDKSLEEEINRYLEPIHTADIQFEPFTQMTRCARHFAKWQKEQMMKEAVEGRIHAIGLHNAIYIKEPEWTDKLDKYKEGDKVLVIVLPKEDQNNG